MVTTEQNIINSLSVDATGNIYCKGTFSFNPEPVNKVSGKDLATVNTIFDLYPNPTYGNFIMNLQLNEDVNDNAVVEIYNSMGRLIKTTTVPVVNGILINEMNFDNKLAEGLYSVRVTVKNKTLQRQLIYQR